PHPVMKTLPGTPPPVASRTRGKTVPHDPPVTPPGAPQPPPVTMEPPSDSVPVPVTHTASSPGPKNSPSSPLLDENWSLVFSWSLSQRANYSRSETPRLPSRSIPSSETEQAQKITLPLPTLVPGSPPYPATPPALLPVCPRSPSPTPATAPGVNTSWSLAFNPPPLLRGHAGTPAERDPPQRRKGVHNTAEDPHSTTPPSPLPRMRAPEWLPTRPHLIGDRS
ncbi:hypothetical protein JTE90_018149, partial [Oedothorax gibbosus]